MNSSIWPITRTLTDTIILHQSGLESNGNEWVIYILPNWSLITRCSWVSNLVDTCLKRSYSFAEVQLVYSTALVNRVAMLSKHCNTDTKRVLSKNGIMLKNRPHLVTFNKSIFFSIWTFQLPLIKSNYYRCNQLI